MMLVIFYSGSRVRRRRGGRVGHFCVVHLCVEKTINTNSTVSHALVRLVANCGGNCLKVFCRLQGRLLVSLSCSGSLARAPAQHLSFRERHWFVTSNDRKAAGYNIFAAVQTHRNLLTTLRLKTD